MGNNQEEPIDAQNSNIPERLTITTRSTKEGMPSQQIQASEEVHKFSLNEYATVAIPDIKTSRVAIEYVDGLDEQITKMMHKIEGSSEWSCSVS